MSASCSGRWLCVAGSKAWGPRPNRWSLSLRVLGQSLQRTKSRLSGASGVAGRNSDNTFIRKMLKWEPNTTLDDGLRATYNWIKEQFEARKKGKRVVE